jgi:hypothetical protein
MAYIKPPEHYGAAQYFRRQAYIILRVITLSLNGERDVRNMKQNPITPLHTVWRNPHTLWTFEEVKAVMIMVVHDCIPTNHRIANINRIDTNRCTVCEEPDTLIKSDKLLRREHHLVGDPC